MNNLRFKFGKNWKNFSKLLDSKRLKYSIMNIEEFIGRKSLEGSTFLDIGCGSGLSSVSAVSLGAEVYAFDYDLDSVKTTEKNLEHFSKGKSWEVSQGSILDLEYISKLCKFDIVYSWGVLHHSGDMWKALENSSLLVNEKGLLAISIYNDQGGASVRWNNIKKAYNRLPDILKPILVLMIGLFFEIRSFIIRILKLQNPLPFKDWKKRKHERGMSVWHDLVDWVGGYPFEVAKPEEIFVFFKSRGFELEYLKTCGGGHGCNEYLFRKK